MNEIIDFSSLISLSRKEQEKLLISAKNGDMKAKEDFIKSYLITIKNIIETRSFGINRLDDNINSQLYEDIFQEGVLALEIAYEKFDFNKSSQACFYFQKSIWRAIHRYLLKNSQSFSIPVETLESFNNIYEFIDSTTLKNERIPSVSEIVLKTNYNRKIVEEAINNLYSSINFYDIEGGFVDEEKNIDEFIMLEDNLSALEIVTRALLKQHLGVYRKEEIKDIFDFGRRYQLKIKNKASDNELLELNELKEKILQIDNSLTDEKSIYDKYESIYLLLRRIDIIIKRVLLSPNERWGQSRLSEYYGVNCRRISQLQDDSLKKIKKYINKNKKV